MAEEEKKKTPNATVPISPGSIRQTTKDRLLGLVDSVPGERKIIILDDWTLRVVDAVCSLHDLLDSGAFLVEALGKRRQPYPTMQAVYFVAPTAESIDALAKDFERDRSAAPPYAEVHILSTGRMGEEQMRRLAGSPIVSFVRTLKEVYLDFLALEARVFTTGSDARLLRPGYAGQTAALADIDRLARQIAAAAVTMGERPIVRYHRSARDQGQLAQRTAVLLNDMLDQYLSGNTGFVPRAGAVQGEVLVVARTVDLIAPVLHEFTYQAMATDLLASTPDPQQQPLLTNGNRYRHGAKTVILDEGDALWTALRHTHIADCSATITQRFRTFVSENKAAARQLQQKKGTTSGDVVSLAQLKDIMGALGEFQEMKAQFTLHMDIAEKCFAVMERKGLMPAAKVEQKLACGVDADGGAVRDHWALATQLLSSNQTLTSPDRARLLCLYLAAWGGGLQEPEKRRLIETANLAPPELAGVKRFATLAQGHWCPGKGDRRSKFAQEGEEQYEVSRFVPQVQLILEDAARGTLSPEGFPAVSGSRAPSQSQQQQQRLPSQGVAASLRARPPSLDSTGPQSTQTQGGQRSVWMFIVGGATWSEARACYATSQRTRTDCFLGSTHMISPEDFLRDLADGQY